VTSETQPDRWEPFSDVDKARIAIALVTSLIAMPRPESSKQFAIELRETVDLLDEIGRSLGLGRDPISPELRERLDDFIATH